MNILSKCLQRDAATIAYTNCRNVGDDILLNVPQLHFSQQMQGMLPFSAFVQRTDGDVESDLIRYNAVQIH